MGWLPPPPSSIYSNVSFSVTNIIQMDTSPQYSLAPFSAFLSPQQYIYHSHTLYCTHLFCLLSGIKFQVGRDFCLFYSLLYTQFLVYSKHPINMLNQWINLMSINFNIIQCFINCSWGLDQEQQGNIRSFKYHWHYRKPDWKHPGLQHTLKNQIWVQTPPLPPSGYIMEGMLFNLPVSEIFHL